jgi:hypothetical protein
MIRRIHQFTDHLPWHKRIRHEVEAILLEDGIRVQVPHPEMNLDGFWAFERAA